MFQQVATLTLEEIQGLKGIFQQMFEGILTFTQSVSKQVDSSAGQPSAKYWKSMFNICFDVLSKVNLIHVEIFLLLHFHCYNVNKLFISITEFSVPLSLNKRLKVWGVHNQEKITLLPSYPSYMMTNLLTVLWRVQLPKLSFNYFIKKYRFSTYVVVKSTFLHRGILKI